MTEKEYLPYKAINVYINQDYLERLLGFILKNKQDLPKEDQISFANHFKKHVKILGFRKINRAPLALQLKAYVPAFEEKDEVVVFSLSTWTKIKKDFAKKVKTWLGSQGWENLALERAFLDSEGFLKKWPEGLTFDTLVENFKKAHPDLEFDRDDLILMVLWISGQLPEEQSEL